MLKVQHVEGKDKGKILVYALSTCIWCRKTKKMLEKLGIAYDFIDVDMLDENEAAEAEKEIEKWNPKGSFPTIVIDDKKCIPGFIEDEIKRVLG